MTQLKASSSLLRPTASTFFGPKSPMHNTAPYGDSTFSGSSLEENLQHDPDALFGGEDPQCAIQKETPIHRTMVNLRLRGHSIKEIAQITRYTAVHVGNVLRQPWAKARMANELREMNADGLREMIQTAAPAAFMRQIELAEDAATPAAVKERANENILDRMLGKPKENLEVTRSDDLDKLSDKELLALLPRTLTSEPNAN